MNEIRSPQPLVKTLRLESDCRNLYVVLYNLFMGRNELPSFIAKHLTLAFPNHTLRFNLTEDGRIYVKVFEGELELDPPCIPDGFHKFLALITALELKPSLLVVDELENSLHPKLLELVLDAFKHSDSTIIAATHNPYVIDICDPKDIIIVEKEYGSTRFKRIKEPEKVVSKLRELGLTLSEGWLWGKVPAE